MEKKALHAVLSLVLQIVKKGFIDTLLWQKEDVHGTLF